MGSQTPGIEVELRPYRAPAADVFLAWKHSRQKTGRPCVGRNGTVVSLPHWEQLAVVSTLLWPPFPPPSWRLLLHALQRLGSFRKFLSAKNCCSPAVKTKSALQSTHLITRS